jgi:hypothetical protein
MAQLITDGGNNIMIMPAFKGRISVADIEQSAVYLTNPKSWD